MAALIPPDWQARAVMLLVVVTGVKALIAMTFPLGVDEAYAIAAARDVSWSYFDHPPLGFWMPIASAQVLGENLLAYRLPFLACGVGTGWVLYLTGRHLGGAKAGFCTLLLFTIAPHMALVPGFAIILTVLGLNLMGDGLRDYLNPRTRVART